MRNALLVAAAPGDLATPPLPTKKRFIYWCDNIDRRSHVVDERKILGFLHWLSVQPNQHRGKRAKAPTTVNAGTLKCAAVEAKGLWTEQALDNTLTRTPDPWTKSLTLLLANKRKADEAKRVENYDDPTQGSIAAAGRRSLDIAEMGDYLFKLSSVVGDRTWLDVVFGEQTMERSDEQLEMNLSRCVAVDQPAPVPSREFTE